MGCVQNRVLGTCASPSEVHPAGKRQWHCTSHFDFTHSLWLPFAAGFTILKRLLIVPVGAMGSFNLGITLSPLNVSKIAVSKVESSRWTGLLPSKSYLAGMLQSPFTCGFNFGHFLWLPFAAGFTVLKRLLIVPVGTMALYNLWITLSPLNLSKVAVSKVESSVCPCSSPCKVYPVGKLQ